MAPLFYGDKFQENDCRLKILWLEDEPESILPKDLELRSWNNNFTITHCSSFQEAIDLYKNCQIDASVSSKTYNLLAAPYDVIIADLRLGNSSEGRANPDKEEGTGIDIVQNLAVVHSRHRYPVLIIPYSAFVSEYQEELGRVEEASLLAKDANVYYLSPLPKATTPQDRLASLISKKYREVLIEASKKGIVHLPFSEGNRLLKKIKNPDIKGKITLATPWGQRSIGLDTLFLDCLPGSSHSHPGGPYKPVHEWIQSLAKSDEEKRAEEYADEFWSKSSEAASQDLYLAALGQPRGVISSEPELRDWLAPSINKEEKRGGKEILKLAMIFLILRERAWRVESASILKRWYRRDEQVESIIQDKMRKGDLGPSGLSQYTEKTFQDTYDSLLDNPTIKSDPRYYRILHDPKEGPYLQAGTISEAFFNNLVDPFPDHAHVYRSLDASTKIGTKLNQQKLLQTVRDLLKGSAKSLSPYERSCARRYIFDHLPNFKEEDWPEGLQESR